MEMGGFSISRDSDVPLYRQLETSLRDALAAGAIPPGERLPAIQEMAVELHVSRNTVRRAFQNLAADGLLEGSAASGFRARGPAHSPTPSPRQPEFNRPAVLEEIELGRLRAPAYPQPLQPDFPDIEEFPLKCWESLRAQVLKQSAPDLLRHVEAAGYLPLREAIAVRLRETRGVNCTAKQVIVCAGAQQALHLAIQTLLSPGGLVGMEEPGRYAVKAAFLHAGARVLPLLVDEEGMIAPEARRQNPPVLMYVTPANQFPLGVKLSNARRSSLLEFARDTFTWILEDDSGGELCYSGQPASSLQGADGHGRVVYLGATGKTLFPSLEIAYLVVPPALLENFLKTKELLGAQPCAIDQATLAQFILEGHLEAHVRRMNTLYYQRLQALAQSVDAELNEFIDPEQADGGLQAVGWLKRGIDEQAVVQSASGAQVDVRPLSSFGRTALLRPGVVFGFAGSSEKQIAAAVKRFARTLRGAARPNFLQRLVGRPQQ
ncbi:MAG: PLP-dependent aminotransferase family protein [Acidobacteriaceae bacterium]|nr:PLP-dependent aminotransferase family protein [Acidobacteriaceae bacterium]